jgi:hypothetical protein
MGAVYRAEDLNLEIPVALKFLAGSLQEDAAALAGLRAEVRSAADCFPLTLKGSQGFHRGQLTPSNLPTQAKTRLEWATRPPHSSQNRA